MIFAKGTNYTVHAEFIETGSGAVTINNILVDEDGNILVDEDGDILVSEENEISYGQIVYAGGTDYTIHAEA